MIPTAATTCNDLAPHTGALIGVIVVLWGITMALIGVIWKLYTGRQERIEEYITRIGESHHQCQSTLAEKYVDIETFRLWQNGREKLWDGIGRIEGKIDNLFEKILVNLLKIAEREK